MNKRSDSQIPEDFAARWKSRFERFAELNDDDAGIAGWSTSGLQTRFRSFRRLWTAQEPGTLWLDVGCGAGTYARFLNAEGLRVIGMDYSLAALLKARARSSAAIEWAVGDVTRLPIRSRALDGVLCFGVLQAIAESRSALLSIAAAMKPSGRLWIDVLNARCVPNRIEIRRRLRAGQSAHLRYEIPEVFRKTLGDCGFDVLAMHWVPILPAKLQRLQPWVECRAVRWLLRSVPALAAWLSHSVLVEARLRGRPGHSS